MGQHHSHNRRSFFRQSFGRILVGASIFEEAFFRASWARAQARAVDANLFTIEKVAEGVYGAIAKPAALTNCNAAIFVLSRDVLVVDAHSKPSAAASLIAQIKKQVTEKPVRYLVNSHFHWDHTQGDLAYKEANAQVEIIASDATKQLMTQLQRDRLKESLDSVPGLIDAAKARLGRAKTQQERDWANDQLRQLTAYQEEMKSYPLELPTVTFDKTHEIKDASGDLELAFNGKAHTAGDIQVFSPSKRVVASGDVIIGFLPNLNDGYPRPWPKTIDSAAAWKFDHIIPGHGPVQHGRARMTQFRSYIEDLTARVERAKKAGTPLADVQKEITPGSLATLKAGGFGTFVADNLAKYTVYLGNKTPVEDRLAANVTAIYNNLDKA
jgi:glyoxylase-like metal-dependent hydrolase (beta-lactamase superfamily II)